MSLDTSLTVPKKISVASSFRAFCGNWYFDLNSEFWAFNLFKVNDWGREKTELYFIDFDTSKL